jgi:hypothetical protein
MTVFFSLLDWKNGRRDVPGVPDCNYWRPGDWRTTTPGAGGEMNTRERKRVAWRRTREKSDGCHVVRAPADPAGRASTSAPARARPERKASHGCRAARAPTCRARAAAAGERRPPTGSVRERGRLRASGFDFGRSGPELGFSLLGCWRL